MIKIEYVCGFANRLFQFSLANIIAKHHSLKLSASPINGFPCSYKTVDGNEINAEPEIISSTSDACNIINRNAISRPLLIKGLFQKASLYVGNQEAIKDRWLRLDPSIKPDVSVTHADLAIHVRRGDYLLHNWGAPFSYYQEAIESTQFRKIVIITDDAHDPFLFRFRRYRPTIVCSHHLNDFACLVNANKIIMSPSTFSWWGAFLSNAEEVVFPIPQHGIWSSDYIEDVDLRLPSIYRQYKYIICREPLKLNTMERLYFEKKYLRMKIRKQGLRGYFKSHAKSALKPWLHHNK
jgi:hypothetical protein